MSDQQKPRESHGSTAVIAVATRAMQFWKAASLLLLLALAAPVAAEPRVALVVGNALYRGNLPSLPNPVNDATVITAALPPRASMSKWFPTPTARR